MPGFNTGSGAGSGTARPPLQAHNSPQTSATILPTTQVNPATGGGASGGGTGGGGPSTSPIGADATKIDPTTYGAPGMSWSDLSSMAIKNWANGLPAIMQNTANANANALRSAEEGSAAAGRGFGGTFSSMLAQQNVLGQQAQNNAISNWADKGTGLMTGQATQALGAGTQAQSQGQQLYEFGVQNQAPAQNSGGGVTNPTGGPNAGSITTASGFNIETPKSADWGSLSTTQQALNNSLASAEQAGTDPNQWLNSNQGGWNWSDLSPQQKTNFENWAATNGVDMSKSHAVVDDINGDMLQQAAQNGWSYSQLLQHIPKGQNDHWLSQENPKGLYGMYSSVMNQAGKKPTING